MIIEHREYVRVDDRLIISWRQADAAEADTDEVRDMMFVAVNREINSMIGGLGQSQPDVARILTQLNHKLDLLADQYADHVHGPSLTRVNISRSGIAFEWAQGAEAGSDIRITMTLPPENNKISLIAKVLDSNPMGSQGRMRVRGCFLPDQENAVSAIAAYIDHVQQMRQEPFRLNAPRASKLEALRAAIANEQNNTAEFLQYR